MKYKVDRNKVYAKVRRLGVNDLLVLLSRVIDMLPDAVLPEVIADYVHLDDVLVDEIIHPNLLHTIRQFHSDSIAGNYYQDFDVNSRNCMEKSRGTDNFIAEHSRLIDSCMKAEQAGDLDTAREGFKLLIKLMRMVDLCEDDIVFFADEGGSWQVGVAWEHVLPAWFRSLSPGLPPFEWSEIVVDALNDFAGYQMDVILKAAHKTATPEQSEALAEHGDSFRS